MKLDVRQLLPMVSLFSTVVNVSQPTVVVTQWSGRGTKNVTYTTIANNMLDNDGNIVPQRSNKRKDMDGRTVYDCVDITGKVRRDGEEYERSNHRFKYKCNNGIEIITESACNANGKLYHIDEEIRSGFLVMKCSENGYKIIGCYYVDNNERMVDMQPGTVSEAGGIVHHCDDNNNNIRYYAERMGCMKYGDEYKEGEEFAKNHLRYLCKNGMAIIIGCYMGEAGRSIEIGDSIVDQHMLHKCYFENGEVKYENYPCGLRDMPRCEPSSGQQSSMKQPAIPKSISGFGSFSIVQYANLGGDKVVTVPKEIKFELLNLNRFRGRI